MSVSIYNSYHCDKDFGMLRFTTETKMHHQQQHSATSATAAATTVPRAKLDHVRRNLFGPVDRKECSRFAQEELAKHQVSASQKWGFDFVRGCPLDDAALYLWERVPPTNEIPEMYTLSRAAHIRPIEPIDRTPSKKRRNHQRRNSYFDLFDEMADDANRYNPPKRNLLDLSFEDVDDGHTSSSSSCDEESFEDDNYDVNLAWMPNSQKLNATPSIGSVVATPIATAATTTTVTNATTIAPNCDDDDVNGHQMQNAELAATCSTLIKRSCDTSCNDKHMKLTSSHTTNATNNSPRILRNSPRIRERQYKITDFLKERKRLQPSVKKVSPKKARISPPSGTILAHFGTQRQ